MWPEPQPRNEPRPHSYDLFDEGEQVAMLHWLARPRQAVGWYLTRTGEPPVRLFVDAAIEELARDERSSPHDWELHAELAAILSTALALDAAGRFLALKVTSVANLGAYMIGAGGAVQTYQYIHLQGTVYRLSLIHI